MTKRTKTCITGYNISIIHWFSTYIMHGGWHKLMHTRLTIKVINVWDFSLTYRGMRPLFRTYQIYIYFQESLRQNVLPKLLHPIKYVINLPWPYDMWRFCNTVAFMFNTPLFIRFHIQIPYKSLIRNVHVNLAFSCANLNDRCDARLNSESRHTVAMKPLKSQKQAKPLKCGGILRNLVDHFALRQMIHRWL